MGMQISAALRGLALPNVPVENPHQGSRHSAPSFKIHANASQNIHLQLSVAVARRNIRLNQNLDEAVGRGPQHYDSMKYTLLHLCNTTSRVGRHQKGMKTFFCLDQDLYSHSTVKKGIGIATD